MPPTIGFVGLGIMGAGMAANLLKAGFPVRGWNRTAARAQALQSAGLHIASSPSDAARGAQSTILCVSDTPDVAAVLFGEQGVIQGAETNSVIIITSTIQPEAVKNFAEKLAAKNLHLIDAPMTGGSEGAAKGTLTFMVGADPQQLESVRPVLAAMGKNIVHVGPVGQGQMVKLVNQILVAGTMLSMCEALHFAQAAGLDLEKTLAAVSGGAAGSWTVTNRGPQVIRQDWRPGFSIDLQEKDLRIARATAQALHAPIPATEIASAFYRSLQARGLGHEGNHALIKALDTLAGKTA